MAKSNSKKSVIKNAQKVAATSSLNSVANKKKGNAKNAQKSAASSSQKSAASGSQKAAKKKATAPKAKGNRNTSKKKSQKVIAGRPYKDTAKSKAKKAKTGKYSAQKTGTHSQKKGAVKMSAAKKAVIVAIAAVLVVFGCTCVAFASIEQSRAQYVPATTVLDGQLDISGMTEPELREILTARVANEISTTLTLNVGDTSHQVRMADIGTVDVDKTVRQAFAPYGDNPVVRYFLTMGELVTGSSPQFNVCTMCDVDDERLAAKIASISANSGAEPRDAGYAFDANTRTLVIAPAKQGVVMNQDATIQGIKEALAIPNNGDPKRLMIQADATIAEPSSYVPGQAIYVDTRRCYVQLYEGGALVEEFDCTPGTSGYATPTGDFYLSYKDPAPTWYNPHSGWSEGMPDTIPPGPSNPLGVRALAVSCGNGIFIHGTTNAGGLGSPGSHGCVRLSNNNIIKLYDMVSEGIPIIIR